MPGREADDFEIDVRIRVLEAYLFESKSHRTIQKEILGLPAPARGGGYVAMSILHHYGIAGNRKGALARHSLDEELAKASGPYLEALGLVSGAREFEAQVVDRILQREATYSLPRGPSEIVGLTRIRIAQHCLRKVVLLNYRQCAVCNVSEADLLVCSHIVPWAVDEKNRLNPTNAICFCAWHDKLFDRGYFGLDEHMAVIVSPLAPAYIRVEMSALPFRLPAEFPPADEFLEYHRANILR